MRDAVLNKLGPVPPVAQPSERGFLAGLVGATLVILVDTLVRLLANGASTGNYDLDLASELSVTVLVIAVVAASIFSSFSVRKRANNQHDVAEAEIRRLDELIEELRGEPKRGG